MKRKTLPARLSDAEADALIGTYVTDAHAAEVIGPTRGPIRIDKPTGEPLLVYVPGALSRVLCREILAALRRAARVTHNRGVAADGKVLSGIVGYYDRYPRWPYCRVTAFTLDDVEGWRDLLRLLYAMGDVYAKVLPRHYKAQRAWVELTSRDFRIEWTPWTTATVNRNQRFKAHRDRGNLKLGMVVMSVPRAVGFTGCNFVMPKWGVAVALCEGDVILFDGDEVHGNTELIPARDGYERISVVCYYRSAMIDCLSAEEEHQKAKRRQPGDPLR